MESFYKTLKRELVEDANFENSEEAKQEVFKYIETYFYVHFYRQNSKLVCNSIVLNNKYVVEYTCCEYSDLMKRFDIEFYTECHTLKIGENICIDTIEVRDKVKAMAEKT